MFHCLNFLPVAAALASTVAFVAIPTVLLPVPLVMLTVCIVSLNEAVTVVLAVGLKVLLLVDVPDVNEPPVEELHEAKV